MANNNDFNSLLSKLQKVEKPIDYFHIDDTLVRDFNSTINRIIKNWIDSNVTLSNEEKKFLDLYSNLQLSFVKYCLSNSITTADVQAMIDSIPGRLFQKTQTDRLAEAVEFIREQQSNDAHEDDLILIYIMRMIDARSLAYRLCFTELSPPPKKLNDELIECLTDRRAKKCLRDIAVPQDSTQKTSLKTILNSRHRFFVGCCTFAVALFERNKDSFEDNDRYDKYIYLLAKYVRTILTTKEFEKYESIIYCVRGILALLTSCVPTEHWLGIMNKALANESDGNAQEKNPFNLDLFALIVNVLLPSQTLQKKAEESSLNEETLLLDIVLVFLRKWSDTERELDGDDEEEENRNNNNNSSPFNEPNQLLHHFRTDEQFKNTAKVIIPYVDAKYDRLRLMALSILSSIMKYQDLEDLKNRKPNMAKDLVKLLFNFTNQAINQPNFKYKGISFQLLLRYLYRFLLQDFIKEETLPYLSQIVTYAKNRDLCALKILRRISTKPEIKEDLLKNADFKRFLETEAKDIYDSDENMYKIVEDTLENLAPPKPNKALRPEPNNEHQAFISYSHKDKDQCDSFVRTLEKANVFTNIWIDKCYMKDDMVDTITKAIRQSKVIFILLSDRYCKSGFCRREWSFAIRLEKEKIKCYFIIIQKDFKKDDYDWVTFQIGFEHYYNIHKEGKLTSLIEHLRTDGPKQSQRIDPTTDNFTVTQVPPLSSATQPDDREAPTKKSVIQWTSKDIQAWCRTNNLEKWCKPLDNYHGRALLELNKVLAAGTHLEHIASDHKISVLDVILFKCELDKLISKPKVRDEQPKKKHVTKRRASKSGAK